MIISGSGQGRYSAGQQRARALALRGRYDLDDDDPMRTSKPLFGQELRAPRIDPSLDRRDGPINRPATSGPKVPPPVDVEYDAPVTIAPDPKPPSLLDQLTAQQAREMALLREEYADARGRRTNDAAARAGLGGFALSGAANALYTDVDKQALREAALAESALSRQQLQERMLAMQESVRLADLEHTLQRDLNGNGIDDLTGKPFPAGGVPPGMIDDDGDGIDDITGLTADQVRAGQGSELRGDPNPQSAVSEAIPIVGGVLDAGMGLIGQGAGTAWNPYGTSASAEQMLAAGFEEVEGNEWRGTRVFRDPATGNYYQIFVGW